MPYLRITKTPLPRRTPLGTYLCFPHDFRLESFSPIIQIDEFVEEMLMLCDGSRTREDILQVLSQKTGEPIDEFANDLDEFVEYMVGEGMLEWSDTPSYVEPIYQRDRPYSITMEVTSACNLSCVMCSTDSGTPRKDDLTLEDIYPFVEQVKKYKPTPFAISGGEPLIKKDIVLYLVEQLSPIKEIAVSIFTNGTLIDTDYAHQLRDAGLQIARVSLDGHTAAVHDAIRGKGAFEKTVQGIKNLKELGIRVNTVSVISQLNFEYHKEIRDYVRELGDSNDFVGVYPWGRSGEELNLTTEESFNFRVTDMEKIVANVSPRNRCNVGETIYIKANGDIFPCFLLRFPEFKVGNIKENDLKDIYDTDIIQELLQVTVKDIEGCKDCYIRYYCGGGCRAHAYRCSKSVYTPDTFDCERVRFTVKKILENGEENTQALMRELIENTKNVNM
ncbi:MAG: PqqD family peptide modification chaperone [Candidatus Methanofastidiosia archaeon]|jgi:radical SAM protein with 4Fe4S-binding SPASM domain